MNITANKLSENFENVKSIAAKIKQDPTTLLTNKDLKILASFECWQLIADTMQVQINSSKGSIDSLIWLGKSYYRYANDIKLCRETGIKVVSQFKLGFNEFMDRFVGEILGSSDLFQDEAELLSGVFELFATKEDQIACLERLCLIFEKKIPNERKLENHYGVLLKLDPKNHKALRYFKLLYTQNERWDEVIKILDILIKTSRYPQIRFRSAQEMAAIFLYQMDQPQTALEILSQYCSSSPLDSTTIRFDAYQRLGDVSGCIRVLQESLSVANNDSERGGLIYRIAVFELALGQNQAARDSFEKSLSYSPSLYDAHEQIMLMQIRQKDWIGLKDQLKRFSESMVLGENKERIIEAYQRLQDSMQKSG